MIALDKYKLYGVCVCVYKILFVLYAFQSIFRSGENLIFHTFI